MRVMAFDAISIRKVKWLENGSFSHHVDHKTQGWWSLGL